MMGEVKDCTECMGTGVIDGYPGPAPCRYCRKGKIVIETLVDDPLAELRREALLVLGYDPDYKGKMSVPEESDHIYNYVLGRVLIRTLNRKARGN